MTGVQTCALPIWAAHHRRASRRGLSRPRGVSGLQKRSPDCPAYRASSDRNRLALKSWPRKQVPAQASVVATPVALLLLVLLAVLLLVLLASAPTIAGKTLSPASSMALSKAITAAVAGVAKDPMAAVVTQISMPDAEAAPGSATSPRWACLSPPAHLGSRLTPLVFLDIALVLLPRCTP